MKDIVYAPRVYKLPFEFRTPGTLTKEPHRDFPSKVTKRVKRFNWSGCPGVSLSIKFSS